MQCRLYLPSRSWGKRSAPGCFPPVISSSQCCSSVRLPSWGYCGSCSAGCACCRGSGWGHGGVTASRGSGTSGLAGIRCRVSSPTAPCPCCPLLPPAVVRVLPQRPATPRYCTIAMASVDTEWAGAGPRGQGIKRNKPTTGPGVAVPPILTPLNVNGGDVRSSGRARTGSIGSGGTPYSATGTPTASAGLVPSPMATSGLVGPTTKVCLWSWFELACTDWAWRSLSCGHADARAATWGACLAAPVWHVW